MSIEASRTHSDEMPVPVAVRVVFEPTPRRADGVGGFAIAGRVEGNDWRSPFWGWLELVSILESVNESAIGRYRDFMLQCADGVNTEVASAFADRAASE